MKTIKFKAMLGKAMKKKSGVKKTSLARVWHRIGPSFSLGFIYSGNRKFSSNSVAVFPEKNILLSGPKVLISPDDPSRFSAKHSS